MSTTILHAEVQRSRFMQHALGVLGRLVPGALKSAPAPSRSLEAQQVRSLACAYAKTDPGFAADLYAAAARHEGLPED